MSSIFLSTIQADLLVDGFSLLIHFRTSKTNKSFSIILGAQSKFLASSILEIVKLSIISFKTDISKSFKFFP